MPLYNLFLNKFILPIGDRLFSGAYLKFINEWSLHDLKSELELEKLQIEGVRNIIEHTCKTVPFYMDKDYKSLSDFPVLTKDVLRNSKDQLISKNYNTEELTEHHSSGSSGVQSFTYMTKEHQFYIRALQTHWWKWSGYEIGDNLLQFGISQKRNFQKKLKDLFYRCDYVKAFGLSPTELKKVIGRSKNRKNLYIAGYPSAINELAKSVEAPMKNINGVICYGDKFFNSHKENFKTAFGKNAKVIETYGCAEGLLMACKYDLDYFYIMSPHVYIEIVDDDNKPVEDGEMGHVLVTCLTNYAMPLIRYRLGDLAIKLPRSEYPKQRRLKYPLLKQVIGRETDIVKTNSGITLNVHSFTGIFEHYQSIKQFKVIQNTTDEIFIEYIIDKNYPFSPDIIEELKDKFIHLTHNSLIIHFDEVAEILPTKSGKPQIIESNL